MNSRPFDARSKRRGTKLQEKRRYDPDHAEAAQPSPPHPDQLLEANGEWVSKQRIIRELFLTQSGARIFELENEHHWPI
jgi:hypothetical protein